jgi:DNA repair photolyase
MHFKKYKSILSGSNGMNIFRGCSHGCIYCDSRSRCYHIDHDFEDIEVKEGAPEQLEAELMRKRKRCMIGTGSMTDSYIPLELKLNYTRRCLEVIDRLGFGLAIQTKSNRILRDLDLLKSINSKAKCVVQTTLTTYDEDLCRLIEPNVSTTRERFEMLLTLKDNGIPSVVWLSPILPFINDNEENLRGLLNYCIEAGVKGILCFGMGVTLREGDREYFYAALDRHFPGVKNKYISRFGNAYECISDNNEELMRIFTDTCKANRIMWEPEEVFAYLRQFPEEKDTQISLF